MCLKNGYLTNGRLSYFLQKSLNEKKLSGKVKVIATDSGKWKSKNMFNVEKIKNKEALKKEKRKRKEKEESQQTFLSIHFIKEQNYAQPFKFFIRKEILKSRYRSYSS